MHTYYNTGVLLQHLPDRKITPATAGPKQVALLRVDEAVFAFTALCPHAGAPLCDGWLDATGKVVCPLHKYRFDPRTGRNTTGEGYNLFRYPVQIAEGEILVGLL